MSESAAAAAAVESESAPATTPTRDYSDSTDADLFARMALAAVSLADAHAAFAEFHRRHAAYLYAVCLKRYRAEAEEVVAETLRRVYESAARFDCATLTNLASPDAARQLVRAWVGQIVRWVAADHFADLNTRLATVAPRRICCTPDAKCSAACEVESELVAAVRAVIQNLPEREQDIAWTVAHGWSAEHGQLRWSQDDLDAIAGRFNLTRDNLRQIRGRLIRKLRTQLEPLLHQRRDR